MPGQEPSEELLDALVLEAGAPGLVRPEAKSLIPSTVASAPAVMRTRHHQLARLLAEGKPAIECAYITGYAISTVQSLGKDPAFAELVAYYKAQVIEQYLDMHNKLATLGSTAVEILQDRLEETPGKFTNEELRKIVEGSCDRSVAPNKAVAAGGKTVINVNFGNGNAKTIEAKATEIHDTEAIPQTG